MSQVTFVENRGKTAFWQDVAGVLKRNGHKVSWIVQNPVYKPSAPGGDVVVLRFPNPGDLQDAAIPEAVNTDRGRTLFGAGHRHYAHYQREIDQALTQLNPSLVIGESTLFHELLTIDACAVRGIPYVHPTGTRYPNGRMMLFEGNTQVPAVRSGDVWSDEKLDLFARSLQTGNALPDYMRVPGKFALYIRKARLALGHARTLWGRILGDHYNTPSLTRKLALSRQLKANLVVWKQLQRLPDTGLEAGPVILYPLQMQPEANIEVWGRPFSNQVEIVERCLSALPANGQVAVKANPKSKYEVSEALLALARRDPRVVLLPLDCRMPVAQDLAVGAVTVTGTVGYEAVFGRGRCISLRHPIVEQHFPAFHAQTPEAAVGRLLDDPQAGRGNLDTGRALLKLLIADSFEGRINELAFDPDCRSPENIERVAGVLEKLLHKLEQQHVA
ncbi:hypothetical protein [Pseudophaeobacter arcticus]|uniref:hypothetical protein n=1 Tax=Pseudophaeobacter arcticus TaxID=385492 RepID=UPI000425CAC7|nr:hypothetical protein [Pseudophaeobacter arcticus]